MISRTIATVVVEVSASTAARTGKTSASRRSDDRLRCRRVALKGRRPRVGSVWLTASSAVVAVAVVVQAAQENQILSVAVVSRVAVRRSRRIDSYEMRILIVWRN